MKIKVFIYLVLEHNNQYRFNLRDCKMFNTFLLGLLLAVADGQRPSNNYQLIFEDLFDPENSFVDRFVEYDS